MLIQKLIIDDSAGAAIVNGGRMVSGKLYVDAGCTAAFDSYYNCMCYTKYRTYTTAENVELRVKVNGQAKASLCLFDGSEHVLSSKNTNENGEAVLYTDFESLSEEGFLYASVTAKTDCEILAAEYHTDACPAELHTAVVICTYRREDFVRRNLKLLSGMNSSFIDRIFVIDNGRTLDAEELSDELIHVLPNKNLGGSGGFTRGIIEAVRSGATHIMLMDDDISFYPESLERMNALVSLLRDEYSESWFSAAMIALDAPFRQYEMGADWNGSHAVVHHHDLDITDRRQLVYNLNDTNAQYGGWWTLLMPSGVTRAGLPLPLFIKFDDVEYGLRKSPDTKIITMNGAAVRHEAFDRKTSFVLDYYNLRNELIINSIHCGLTAGKALKRFWKEILKECMLYRYDCCKLVFMAVDDFLQGADGFLVRDNEELNSALISSAPKMSSLSDIPEWSESLRCDDTIKDNHITPAGALTLGGHLIPPPLMRGDITALPLSRTGAGNIYKRRTVIQYQLGGDKGIVTRKSFGKLMKRLAQAAAKSVVLIHRFKKAKASYSAQLDALTSFSYWNDRLGLKGD